MINLVKGACPEILVKKQDEWTAALLAAQSTADRRRARAKYNHPQVKEALISETAGKCAYCESKLRHIQHGDIEHIRPKSDNPHLAFSWENLTLACQICNQRKSNLDPDFNNILDPYNGLAEDDIVFCGALASGAGRRSGARTIDILGLNRPELIERRAERLGLLQLIIEKILDQDIPAPVRAALLEDYRKTELASTSEFAAMARSQASFFFGEL